MLKEYFNALIDGDMLMKDKQGFGSRVREMREHQNLAIEKAAELCNRSESTWKQYERGEGLPSVLKLKNICLALKGKPEYIYGSEFFLHGKGARTNYLVRQPHCLPLLFRTRNNLTFDMINRVLENTNKYIKNLLTKLEN